MNRKLLAILLALALVSPALAEPEADGPGSRDGDRSQRERTQDRRGGDEGPHRGGDRDRSDRDGRRPMPEAIDPADLDVALEILQEFRPSTAEELRELAKTNREEAAARVARSFPKIADFVEMKKDSPRRFELHLKSMRTMRAAWPLYRAYYEARRENNEEKMNELRGKIREHVATMFDIRLELRKIEIEELRQQVQDLEKEIKRYDTERDELIDQRLEEDLNRRHRFRDHDKDDKDRDRDGDRRGPRDRGGED